MEEYREDWRKNWRVRDTESMLFFGTVETQGETWRGERNDWREGQEKN